VSGLGQYALGPSSELFALIEMTTSAAETGLDLVLQDSVVSPSARTVMAVRIRGEVSLGYMNQCSLCDVGESRSTVPALYVTEVAIASAAGTPK